jgi:hypothetical protein
VSATVTVQLEAVSVVEAADAVTVGGFGASLVAIGPNPLPLIVTVSPPAASSEDGVTPVMVGAAYPVVLLEPDAAEV